jgi:hypothetical protein
MAFQTSFAKKMAESKDCDYRFLALLRNDSIVFPSPTLARNTLGSNDALTLFLTQAPFFFRAALHPMTARSRQINRRTQSLEHRDNRRTHASQFARVSKSNAPALRIGAMWSPRAVQAGAQ